MSSGIKKILIAIFILAVVGAGTGYYLYNKGPVDVSSASGIDINAVKLYDSYLADSINARAAYSGKILSVTGTVASVSNNQQGDQLVMLNAGEDGRINCTMEEKNIILKPGMEATIKGLCSGIGQGDADLGIAPDVYLTRCYSGNR